MGKVIYNKLYIYVLEINILFKKCFTLQTSSSTEKHLITQLLQSFDENPSISGIIKELSKAFDTVNHGTLLKK